MAIKVGTDTVITDLKALNGITGTDDTTQTAITSLYVHPVTSEAIHGCLFMALDVSDSPRHNQEQWLRL